MCGDLDKGYGPCFSEEPTFENVPNLKGRGRWRNERETTRKEKGKASEYKEPPSSSAAHKDWGARLEGEGKAVLEDRLSGLL